MTINRIKHALRGTTEPATDVTRYRCTESYGNPVMDPDEDGQWVSYDDVKHLLSVEPKLEPRSLVQAKANAERVFDEWNDVTGVFERGVSYDAEIRSVIDDAVTIGWNGGIAEKATSDEPSVVPCAYPGCGAPDESKCRHWPREALRPAENREAKPVK